MVELEKRVQRVEVFVNKMEAKRKCEWKTEDMSRKRVSFFCFVSLQPSSVVKRTTSTGALGRDCVFCWVRVSQREG